MTEKHVVRVGKFWGLLDTREWRCKQCGIEVPHEGPFKHACSKQLLLQQELFSE